MKLNSINIKFSILVGLLVLAIFYSISSGVLAYKSNIKIVISLEELDSELDRLVSLNPQLANSSNPYNYTKNNQVFQKIVSYGYEALPMIEETIKSDQKYGLNKYILAIAAEEIAKVDLKKGEYPWLNAEEFTRSWTLHLQDVPNKVQEIQKSELSVNEKNEKLIQLGIAVIPFIYEDVKNGKIDFSPALYTLLSKNQETPMLISNKNSFWKEKDWIKENEKKIKDIESLVINKRNEKNINKNFMMNKVLKNKTDEGNGET